MGSPTYTVHAANGEYVAACKYAEDAGAVVSAHGQGAKIKIRHGNTVWHEGYEMQPAGESYDFVAETIAKRHHDVNVKALAKLRLHQSA